MGPWECGGGKARAAKCAATLEQGQSITMQAAVVEDACSAVLEALRLSALLQPIDIHTETTGSDPLTILIDEALDSRARLSVPRTIRGLLNSDDLADHAILVCANRDISAWARFLKLFQVERGRSSLGARAPVLALFAAGGVGDIVDAAGFDDLGMVEPFDVAAHVHERQRWGSGLVAEVCSSVTVETACSDFDLADQLMQQSPEVALEPTPWLTVNPVPANQQGVWRGRSEPDSRWLAMHDPTALRRRIWRGQVSVLLPFVEEVRTETIVRHGKWLRSGARDRETDEVLALEDYEWPELHRQFKRSTAPMGLIDMAAEMRLLRNSLAHCRPVFMHELRAAMQARAASR